MQPMLWMTVAVLAAALEPAGLVALATETPGPGALATVQAWISTTYVRAPALVLGLGILVALPPLALAGLILRRRSPDRPRAPDATQVYRRGQRQHTGAAQIGDEVPLWPSHAWVEVNGGGRHEIGAGILRLGRDEDNDICLPDRTVHRYHAAIHRTDDAQYLITDLSSAGGNGVLVNGLRVAEALLNDGDTIDLGQAKLKFASRPA